MSGTKDFSDLFGQSAAELAATKGEKPQKTRPKYTSLRDDQLDDLDAQARDLMDKRVSKKRRITSNTLIRVAIDAMLAQPELLEGDDERELRENYFRALGILKDGENESSNAEDSKSLVLKDFKDLQDPHA